MQQNIAEYAHSMLSKLTFLLDNYIETEDGKFTFPDGESFDCKKAPCFRCKGYGSVFDGWEDTMPCPQCNKEAYEADIAAARKRWGVSCT